MSLINQVKSGDWHSVELAIRQLARKLGPSAVLNIASLTLSTLIAEDIAVSGTITTTLSDGLLQTVGGVVGSVPYDNGLGCYRVGS